MTTSYTRSLPGEHINNTLKENNIISNNIKKPVKLMPLNNKMNNLSNIIEREKEKILFSGDTLFWNSYGRTDLYGGDEFQMIDSLKKLLSLPDDVKVFPGHGKYGFTLSDLSFY